MDSFALVQSSRFSTTDRWSWRITALAFPMRISNSLFCLPSLVNETPRYLNFSDCFSGTPSIWREHCFGCLDRHIVSVFVVLVFIPAGSMISNLNGSGSVRVRRKKAVFTGSWFGFGSTPWIDHVGREAEYSDRITEARA